MRRLAVVTMLVSLTLVSCSTSSDVKTNSTHGTAVGMAATTATTTTSTSSSGSVVAGSPTLGTSLASADQTATRSNKGSEVVVGKWAMVQGQYASGPEIFGEILNSGDRDAISIHIVVTLYDASGIVLGSSNVSRGSNIIRAGGLVPFSSVVPNVDASNVADTKITVQATDIEPGSTQAGIYTDSFKVLQFNWNDKQFTGEIQNTGDVASTSVAISVLTYDAAGNPVGVYFTPADLNQMDPGSTSSFTGALPADTPKPDHWVTAISGYAK